LYFYLNYKVDNVTLYTELKRINNTMKSLSFIFLLIIINNTSFAAVINVPQEQPTIQAGIDAANNGDTVLVQPGTYVENIDYKGKLITVGSLFLTTQDTSYISQTVIDGNQADVTVSFISGEDSTTVLVGFTVTNGIGGIQCENASSPRLLGLTVTGNAGTRGAGVYCHGNSCPRLENVTISDNDAGMRDGGGFCCFTESNASLFNVTVTGNSTDAKGGGIMIYYSNVTLESVKVLNNSSLRWGGGIHFQGTEKETLLKKVTVSNNDASFGGGISLEFASLVMEDVTVTDNTANTYGGGMTFVQSYPVLKRVTVSGNSLGNSLDCMGGGIYSLNSGPVLQNVVVSENTINGAENNWGGGIAAHGYTFTIINSDISRNAAVGGLNKRGDGIHCRQNLTMINSILWNNPPQELYLVPSCSVLVAYSDIQGGKEGIVNYDSSLIHWQEGNINEDPLFKNPGGGDFHLTGGSPCIDTGTAFFEWQGDTLVNLSANEYIGRATDMGAYEFEEVGSKNDPVFLHNNLALYHNYPDPYNSEGIIRYQLPGYAYVSLKIYTVKGRLLTTLVDSYKQPGNHTVNWDSSGCAPGIFYIKLSAGDRYIVRKVVVLK
jgi:hypothetical protein